jgi:hypothetical protein
MILLLLFLFINHLKPNLMLKYSLVENALALNPNGYVAKVSSPETKDMNAIIDYMVSEGTGLTRPQALAYFEKLIQSIEYFVGQGHRVTTPLFRVKPTITGVFANSDDAFDSSRHSINIRTSSGLRLLDLITKIKLEKTVAPQPIPILRSYTDGMNQTFNASAVSDGLGVVKGKWLRFDPADNRQGVFFVSVTNPATEIQMTGYTEIMPSKVHFRIPAIPAGDYRVVVRTMPPYRTDMRSHKHGSYPQSLAKSGIRQKRRWIHR